MLNEFKLTKSEKQKIMRAQEDIIEILGATFPNLKNDYHSVDLVLELVITNYMIDLGLTESEQVNFLEAYNHNVKVLLRKAKKFTKPLA